MDTSEKYTHIKGWGIDADPKNEPTYPMKNYTGDDHKRLDYQRPPQQEKTIEVLHSNERPGLSAVFGTSVPLSGLSGNLRRKAFEYSEGHFGHWFILLLADRINVIEGIIDDFKKGHPPNVIAEVGGNAAWKYNKKGVVRKIVVGSLVTLTMLFLFSRSGKKHCKKK